MLSLPLHAASLAAIASDVMHAEVPPASAAPELAWAGLILLIPLLSAIGCGLCAAFRVRGKAPAVLTVVSLAICFCLTVALYASAPSTPVVVHLFDWINFSWAGSGLEPASGAPAVRSFIANFALYIDPLTLLWMLFVTFLGTLIALYASEYMSDDLPSRGGRGYARFFGGVSIFLFAMTALVMGDNLVMLYLGWEGVGFASYMLIGYYYKKPTAVAAAKKAFIMNRIGDLGLAASIWLIWLNFGTVEYDALFKALSVATSGEDIGWSIQAIPFLMMLGAFGKSAQVPLYVWLPDAMEGPTPVSALIHAATMVTAGVYLIARMYPVFLLHPMALPVVGWVGGLTALLAATIGMAQYDIKRVMAYSTVSQLGYMFLGLGVMSSFGAVYHVFTHAFFKAVLFLSCGAVMHGFAGQLDLRKLSGLRHLPGWRIMAWSMFIGCLCLSGFPGTSGFFSKDEILAQAFVTDTPAGAWNYRILGWIGVITAGLTAYYAFRVWFRVCDGPLRYEPGDEPHGPETDDDHGHTASHGGGHGADRAHGATAAHAGHGHGGSHDGAHGDGGDFHPHAPGLAINLVLVVLSIGALLAVIPFFWPKYGDGWVQNIVEHSSAAAGMIPHGDAHAGTIGHESTHPTLFGFDPHKSMYFVSSFFGIAGLVIAAWFHRINRRAADTLRSRLLASRVTRWLPMAMENKWYVDEVYNVTIRWPLWILGHIFAAIDSYIVDNILVDGTARLPRRLGHLFQPLQNGVLQGYAVTMAGGVGLILAWVVWVWMRGMAS